MVRELRAKLVLRVIARQVSAQDVKEAGVLHRGLRVFRSGVGDEATEGLHRYRDLAREVAIHDVVIGESKDHVSAPEKFSIPLEVLLALLFR